MKLSIAPKEGRSKAFGRVLSGEEETGPVAEKPTSDRMILIATDSCDPSVFDGGDDATGIRAITVTKGFLGFSHVAEEYSTGQLSVVPRR